MFFKNKQVASDIEKTGYESSDSHYKVGKKRQVSSILIQGIICAIFCIMPFGYEICERISEIQIEIVKYITADSNARFYYMEFTYNNISKMCFSTTFSFTSITYLQGSHEAVEATTRSADINKKFQLWEFQLHIHADCRTYVNVFTHLLQNAIKQIILLIIRLYYKRSKIPKNASRIILHPSQRIVLLFLGTLEVILVYQIHHHLNHHALFFSAAFGNRQCE